MGFGGVSEMEGAKRCFYIVLGFIGIMLAGTTFVCVLIQFKMEASLPLTLFCIVSWFLYILTVLNLSGKR